jgi:hypothetical protein
VLEACRSINATFVAFSPLARGWLTNTLEPGEFVPADIRRGMPRFKSESFIQNRPVLEEFVRLAGAAGCTPGQLALAWLLNRAPHIVPIPGTRSAAHFDENLAAVGIQLDSGALGTLERLFEVGRISGDRYPPATQLEIDTEEFA